MGTCKNADSQAFDFSLPPAGGTEEHWGLILGFSLLEPFSPSFSLLKRKKKKKGGHLFWYGAGCYGVVYPTATIATSSDTLIGAL